MPRGSYRRRRRSRKVVRKLTARGINRALTSCRSFRGQQLVSINSVQANSDFPIRMAGLTNSTSFPSGLTIFGGWGYARVSSLPNIVGEGISALAGTVPTTFIDNDTGTIANGIRFYGNWVTGQIRNCSLNPCKIVIYDMICIQDCALDLSTFNNSLLNFMFQNIYSDLARLWQLSDLELVRDTSEAAFLPGSAASFGFAMTQDIVGVNSTSLAEYFKPSRVHKVILAPGQSYIWKVKGFRPYEYYATRDQSNRAVKHQTYIPIIKCHGEIGLSAGGTIGYTQCTLPCRFDYGVKAYNVHRNYTRAQATAFATMPPTNTAILGPSEEQQAA